MERRFFLGFLSSIPGFRLFAPRAEAELEHPKVVEPEIETVDEGDPPEPTHRDFGKFLWDIHQWCVQHPGATCLSADVPQWRYVGYSAFVGEGEKEQCFYATIHIGDLKTSFPRVRPAMRKRLRQLLKNAAGRNMIGSILNTSNGWNDLGGYLDLSSEMASVTWKTEYLELPNR